MDERDFKDLIKRDINFAIKGDEMEMLWDYYGKKCRKGFVDYKLWIDDVTEAQKRREERTKSKTDKQADKPKEKQADKSKEKQADKPKEKQADKPKEKQEELKIEEIPISVKPSPNLPTDNRYSMKNTVVGRYPESRKQRKRRVKASETTLQDMIKAIYLRDVFIEDFFKRFGKGRNYILSESSLHNY